MARKNRSNNSFAPIVVTVLVAGVVGYYAFIKTPPQPIEAQETQDSSVSLNSIRTPPGSEPMGRESAKGDSPVAFNLGREPESSAGSKLGGSTAMSLESSGDALEARTGIGSKLGTGATSGGASVGLNPTPSSDTSSPVPSESSEGGSVDASESTPDPTPTPTPTPKAESKPVASNEVYTIQAGDVIIAIAENWFGESGRHDEIIALNPGVDPAKLQIGQILKMPVKSKPRTKPVDPTLQSDQYRIAPNDNFTKIARAVLGDEARASEIATLNPDLDPGNLQVGAIIKLPPKQISKPASVPVKRPSLRSGEEYYTVKSGDSLARIVGELWGVQREDWVDLLYQRNKEFIGEDRTKLSVDQVLVVPVKPKS